MTDAPAAPEATPSPSPPAPARKRPGLGRWLLRVAAALALGLVATVIFRNTLIRAGMEAAVTRVTGFPFTVDSFRLGLLDARVEIGGMRLSNPDGFEDPRCLDVPRVVAQVDLASLRSEELHLPEIVLDLKEVVVVRRASGETNLDRLKALGGSGAKEGKEPAKGRDGGGGKTTAAERRWRIDRLELTIGKVRFLDYSSMKDGKPREETWDLGVDHEEFRNVDSPEAIVRIIVLKVLKGTPIRLVNATVEKLTGSLGKALEGTAGALGGAAESLGKGVKGLGGAVRDVLGGDK